MLIRRTMVVPSLHSKSKEIKQIEEERSCEGTVKGKFGMLHIYSWHDTQSANEGDSKEGEVQGEAHKAHHMQIILARQVVDHSSQDTQKRREE